MEMLDSLLEYCKTMIFASSMPSLSTKYSQILSSPRGICVFGGGSEIIKAHTPLGNQLSELAMAIAGQEFD
jgi:hypothetical protein